jgi:peptidyl-prolyl cis-trans isomerase SurA
MYKINKIFFLSILLIGLVFCSFVIKAQEKELEGSTIDKIIAIVGNEIIMQSDLDGQVALYAQQDPSIKMNDPAIRQKVLDALINEKLVIAKAQEDSMTVTEEEIEQGWLYQLGNLIKRYGDEKRIEDIYGMSISRIKNEYRDEIRKQLLAQKLQQKEFGELKVSQREIDEFFAQYKDSLPEIPDKIELYHIVKNVESSKTQKDEQFQFARRIRDSIAAGGSFADYAKRYSADIATAKSGGELGWIEKGKLFKEFEDAAFSLIEGQISQPVETPFGFHVIQTLRKNKDSVFTRHILFKIGQTGKERDTVIHFLNKLKELSEKGDDFEKLAKAFSDEKETAGFGGFLGKFPLDYIPGGIKDLIEKLKEGGISEPIQYSNEPKLSFHIIYKKKIIKAHKPNLQDDNKEITQMATNFKQNKLYQDWVMGLRKTMHWEIVK